jgi:hypothetical protein
VAAALTAACWPPLLAVGIAEFAGVGGADGMTCGIGTATDGAVDGATELALVFLVGNAASTQIVTKKMTKPRATNPLITLRNRMACPLERQERVAVLF